jgi:hypothetical protein
VRVFPFADVEITQMMRRAIHTFGPAAALVFAALVVLALFLILGQVLTPTHQSGGCSGIPLVNGQPAYRCANIPVPPGQ